MSPDVPRLLRVAGEVIQATIDTVLMGGEPDLEAWRMSVEPVLRHLQGSGSEDIEALVLLSRVVLAEDSNRLPELIQSIPARQRQALALAKAVQAARGLDTSDPDSLNGYVLELFSLHEYRGAQSQPRAVMERLAGLQWRALELRPHTLDLKKALNYVVLANALARSFGETKHLDRAFALIAPILKSSSVDRFWVLGNLLNTCGLQAQCRPLEAERYIVRSLELATVLFESRREYEHHHPDAGLVRAVIVNAVRRLISANVKLVDLRPERAAEHATAAWRYASSLLQFADELDDPDVRREAIAIQERLRETMRLHASLPRDGTIAPAGSVIPEGESLNAYAKRFDDYVNECSADARAVLGMAPGAAQRDAATEHLRRVYESLEQTIPSVLREVGLTRHASRLLLALGAVASPRPLQVLKPAVHKLVFQSQWMEAGSEWTRRNARLEEVPPRSFFEEEVNYAARIIGLAAYMEELGTKNPGLGEALRAVVRAFNRQLVRSVLSALGRPRAVQGKAMSRVDDLVELLAMVGRFGGGERDAGAEQSEGLEERSPFRESQVVRFELEQSKALRPEDLLGTNVRVDGKPYQVCSLLGTGTSKAVFVVKHDGRESSFSMGLQVFGPGASLQRYLESVRRGRAQPDQDLVIEICDAGLAREPHGAVFALHKGRALVHKGDLAGASAAFDVALTSAPDNRECLMHKTVALALLGQHSGAVVHMARTARLDPGGFHRVLEEWGAAREDLAASVRQVLTDEPDRSDARHLLVAYFS